MKTKYIIVKIDPNPDEFGDCREERIYFALRGGSTSNIYNATRFDTEDQAIETITQRLKSWIGIFKIEKILVNES